MDPWDEMIKKSSAGYFKHEWTILLYPSSPSEGNSLRLYPSSSSSSSAEGNRLQLYSSSEGNWLRLYSSSTAWSRVVIITTPDRNRGTYIILKTNNPFFEEEEEEEEDSRTHFSSEEG
jgi:hypothetical protein